MWRQDGQQAVGGAHVLPQGLHVRRGLALHEPLQAWLAIAGTLAGSLAKAAASAATLAPALLGSVRAVRRSGVERADLLCRRLCLRPQPAILPAV